MAGAFALAIPLMEREKKMTTDEQELWENASRGKVGIRQFDTNGKQIVKIIDGLRKFQITASERKMNQELAAIPSLDIFSNGTLRPLRIFDGTEDAKEIAENPNHLSEDDMRDVIKSHHKAFDSKIAAIQNLGTIEKMLEIAESEDSEAPVRAVTKLRERLAQLNPAQAIETSHIGSGNEDRAGGIKAVTPK